jgi:CHASE2 domain-containing sensor protein
MIAWRRLLETLSSHLVLGAAGLVLSALGSLFFIKEWQLLDWRFQWRGYQPASEQVAIVAIDRPLTRDWNGQALTPRDTLAKLLRKVAAYQPAVIGMDFDLHEEESNDSLFQKLEQAILATNNLVLPLALQNT